jgi:hypothetical protein
LGDTQQKLPLPGEVHAEALEPIIKFRRYKIFEHTVIREFYSLLRASMIGARGGPCGSRRTWKKPFGDL